MIQGLAIDVEHTPQSAGEGVRGDRHGEQRRCRQISARQQKWQQTREARRGGIEQGALAIVEIEAYVKQLDAGVSGGMGAAREDQR